jgi:ketosteroid isomerase-like protein|tara:strand:- start:27249 stop:27629 length:381 start_codon:yes stop_codon:yes gene_type:complete
MRALSQDPDNRTVVASYYPHIDRLDLDWVLALFAADAVYERAGAVYSGVAAISRFFREERQIRGLHSVQRIWSDGDSAVAVGEFRGHGASGDPREVRFADFWQFNQDGLVQRRQTYLALGHDYVQE